MTILEFVEHLEANGVELLADSDRLRYRGEKGVLTPEALGRLKEQKSEIIALQQDRARRFTLCPLAYGQSALWFLQQLSPHSAAYNVGFVATISSKIDPPAMRRALNALALR